MNTDIGPFADWAATKDEAAAQAWGTYGDIARACFIDGVNAMDSGERLDALMQEAMIADLHVLGHEARITAAAS